MRLDKYVVNPIHLFMHICTMAPRPSKEKEMNNVTALKAHLAINVSDVPRSIDFYKRVFGIEPSKVRNGYAKFDVANPPLNLTLNQIPFETAGALSHLGIQVSSTEGRLA